MMTFTVHIINFSHIKYLPIDPPWLITITIPQPSSKLQYLNCINYVIHIRLHYSFNFGNNVKTISRGCVVRCLHNNLQTVLSVDTGTGAKCPLCRLILNMSQGAGACPPPSPHPLPSQSHSTNWQEYYWKYILQVLIFFSSFNNFKFEVCWCLCWVLLLKLCLQFLIVEMDRESGWREFLYYQIKCLFLVLNDKIWVFSSEILGTISYTEDVFEILFNLYTDIVVICCLHTTAQLL